VIVNRRGKRISYRPLNQKKAAEALPYFREHEPSWPFVSGCKFNSAGYPVEYACGSYSNANGFGR